MLACGKRETVFEGDYSEAYDEWEVLASNMPVPLTTVVLAHRNFNHDHLLTSKDLSKNGNIIEIVT